MNNLLGNFNNFGLNIIQSPYLNYKIVEGWHDLPIGRRPPGSDWRTTSRRRQWKVWGKYQISDTLGTILSDGRNVYMTPAMYNEVRKKVVVQDPIRSVYNFNWN